MAAKMTKSIPWQGILAFLMFCDLLLEIADMIVPIRHLIQMQSISIAGNVPKVLLIIAGLVTAVFAGYVLFKLLVSGTWEVRIFFVYVLWLILTRILNGDHFLRREFLTVMDIIITFLMFASASFLNDNQRERLLSALVIFYTGFFVIVCCASLFITITNTYLCVNPKYDIWLRLSHKKGVNSLTLFSQNRLLGASWLYSALTLLIYSFIKQRKATIRLLILLCILIVYITIPLLHSRTIQITIAVSCGMLALLIFLNKLEKQPIAIRISVLFLITTAAILLSFFSYYWSNNIIAGLRSYCAPRFESYYSELENKADPEIFDIDYSSYASGDVSDQRELSSNTTLSGRTRIWLHCIRAIKNDLSIAAYGSLSDELMEPVNEQLASAGRTIQPHSHNMFLQILMLTGIPGLLLAVCWTVIIVIKMIRVFFSSCYYLSEKYLTIPITGVLIWHLVEAGLFTKTDIFGKVFFILSGLFISCYKTHLSEQ